MITDDERHRQALDDADSRPGGSRPENLYGCFFVLAAAVSGTVFFVAPWWLGLSGRQARFAGQGLMFLSLLVLLAIGQVSGFKGWANREGRRIQTDATEAYVRTQLEHARRWHDPRFIEFAKKRIERLRKNYARSAPNACADLLQEIATVEGEIKEDMTHRA